MIRIENNRTEVRGSIADLMADFARVCIAMKEVVLDDKNGLAESFTLIMSLRQIFDDAMLGKFDDAFHREDSAEPSKDTRKCFSRDMMIKDLFDGLEGRE